MPYICIILDYLSVTENRYYYFNAPAELNDFPKLTELIGSIDSCQNL